MPVIPSERHEKSLNYALEVLKRPEYIRFIKRIYLYGSCARKEQKYNSDVDLFVCTDSSITPQIKRELKTEVTPNYTLPEVELRFGTEGASFSFSTQFNKNIKEEGILIWERD